MLPSETVSTAYESPMLIKTHQLFKNSIRYSSNSGSDYFTNPTSYSKVDY